MVKVTKASTADQLCKAVGISKRKKKAAPYLTSQEMMQVLQWVNTAKAAIKMKG